MPLLPMLLVHWATIAPLYLEQSFRDHVVEESMELLKELPLKELDVLIVLPVTIAQEVQLALSLVQPEHTVLELKLYPTFVQLELITSSNSRLLLAIA